MASRMIEIVERYASFENILPEELPQIDFSELTKAQEEIKKIMNEDLELIKKISEEKNKGINFENFRDPFNLVSLGFFLESDPHQEDEEFSSAHWYMSMVTLEILTAGIFDLSQELVKYYKIYKNPDTTNYDKKFNYNRYSRTWMDFYGNLINIKQSIFQYHDLFIRTANILDPEKKENPYYAYKSDSRPEDLHSAVKELLISGNEGRLEGFQLLRSMIEIHVTRELFELSTSNEYRDKKVQFNNKSITSVKAICNSIDRLGLGQVFQTDNIRRVYDWGSIVSHRGFRTDEYITWFMRAFVARLCNIYKYNIEIHKDRILEDLENSGQIKLIDNC